MPPLRSMPANTPENGSGFSPPKGSWLRSTRETGAYGVCYFGRGPACQNRVRRTGKRRPDVSELVAYCGGGLCTRPSAAGAISSFEASRCWLLDAYGYKREGKLDVFDKDVSRCKLMVYVMSSGEIQYVPMRSCGAVLKSCEALKDWLIKRISIWKDIQEPGFLQP